MTDHDQARQGVPPTALWTWLLLLVGAIPRRLPMIVVGPDKHGHIRPREVAVLTYLVARRNADLRVESYELNYLLGGAGRMTDAWRRLRTAGLILGRPKGSAAITREGRRVLWEALDGIVRQAETAANGLSAPDRDRVRTALAVLRAGAGDEPPATP